MIGIEQKRLVYTQHSVQCTFFTVYREQPRLDHAGWRGLYNEIEEAGLRMASMHERLHEGDEKNWRAIRT
jgi:hypothetical protein